MRYKLISKFVGNSRNMLDIGIVYANGRIEEIAKIVFPNDGQLGDNVQTAEEICKALNKRIRQSI